jgi:hypothetical protein
MLGAVAHLAALVAADGRGNAVPVPVDAVADTATGAAISGQEPAATLGAAESGEPDSAVPAYQDDQDATAPAVSGPVPASVPAGDAVPGPAVPAESDNPDGLAARTRALLADGPIGRTRLARELDVSERKARKLLTEVAS